MEAITPFDGIDDLDIQKKVEALAGKGTRVVGCEKSSWFQREEVLLINGYPVALHGEEGARIKAAMMSGQVPPTELLNTILMRAGILKDPMEFETTFKTEGITKTKESVTLLNKFGRIVDGSESEVVDRMSRSGTNIDSGVSSVGSVNSIKSFGRRSDLSLVGSSSSWSSESDEVFTPSSSLLSPSGSGTFSDSPSIFGTVAAPSPLSTDSSYHTNHQRKTLPQTPITGNGSHASESHYTVSDRLSSLSSASSTSSSSSTTDEKTHDSPLLETNEIIPLTTTQNQSNDWDNALVYQDTNLVSGTLDALIQHLVPTQSYYPDRAYVFAFLLSSRLYIRPHELLGRVFRLAVATTQHSSKIHTSKETKIISHVVQLLGEWADLFPYDFRDERMMAHVSTITQRCIAVNPPIRQDVSQLLSSLLSRLTALERYEDFLQRINTEAALGEPLTSSSILTICPNPLMLAQQLTHIELDRLSHIGPEEFVQAFAKENSQVETKYKDLKKTRNLESYVQWFNRLSYYVATEICKMPKKKSRIRVIEYWIEAAKECFNIGNFNSLMAVIAGLNMSPVSRLKKTWHKVSSSQLSILEHQMDPSSNFSSYRSTLKAAVWRSAGAADERQKIVIPFFSLLVKDLYFLNEACASNANVFCHRIPSGHINFDKFWQLAKQVTEVIAWQQITCPFPKTIPLINTLQTAPIFNETALCLSSYECEAADNPQEKERLKYLRNEGNNKTLLSSTSSSSSTKEDLKK